MAIDAGGWGGFRLVPTLLAARGRMVANAVLRGGRERRGWALIACVVALGASAAGYRLAVAALTAADPSPAALEPAVTGVLAMVAGFTGITAVTFALGAYYFARDLETLLVAPVPPRAVLLTKTLVQLLTGAGIGALLAGPPLVAYLGRHGALAALPWVGLCVVAMACYPLVAGAALTVAAVRLLPARRVRDAGGLLVTIVVFGVTAGNLLLRGADGFTRTPALLDPGRGSGVSGSPWLPMGWAALSGLAMVQGEVGTALLWGVPMLLGSVALLLALARLGEGAFLTGYQRSAEASRGRRRRARQTPGRGRRPAWTVIARKDLRETLRDASQLGQLVLPLALFAFYIASPTSTGALQSSQRLPAWYGTALTAGFASLFAASGVALRGVGSEGRRLWVLRVAPVGVRAILLAKFATGTTVATGLGLVLLAVGAVRLRLGALESLALGLRFGVVVAGLVGLAVGLGAIRPRLDWTDPRRSVGVWTSLVFLALGSAYLGTQFIVLALPYAAGGGSGAVLAADLVAAGLAAVVALGPMALGARRLGALEL